MRSAVFVCACALSLVAGCATSHREARLTSQQLWEALCNRMPQREISDKTGNIRRSSLTRKQETDLAHTAKRAMDSVVRIETANPGRTKVLRDTLDTRAVSARTGGTGVVISPDGLILTNEHVVRFAQAVTVIFRDGTQYPVKTIAVHPYQDMAVLKIARNQIPYILPSLEQVKSGTPVVAISCMTDHHEQCYRTGLVTSERTSLQRELDPAGRKNYADLVETTVKLEPGFSGGPLLNSDGRLVGLNVAVVGSLETDQQRGYAIPFDQQSRENIGELVTLARTPQPESP